MQAPTYPLGPTAFRRALRTGHGRVLVHLLRHGAADVKDDLLYSVLRSPAFDEQTEDSRAPWIDMLVCVAGLREDALATLIRADAADRYWDRRHRAELLALHAARGSDVAHELLYVALSREQNDVVAWSQIIALDGAHGLLAVVRELGHWLEEDPGFRVNDAPLQALDELLGEGAALRVLRSEAGSDPDVARYLRALAEPPDGPRLYLDPANAAGSADATPDGTDDAISATEFLQRLRGGPEAKRSLPLASWARKADAAERARLFEALLEEQDPEHIRLLLQTLAEVGPPRFDERLVEWTASPNAAIRRQALRLLAGLGHPRVRELALLRLVARSRYEGALQLLLRNFAPGDFAHFETLGWPQPDDDATHRLASDVIDVAAEHRSLEAAPALLLAYEHSPCGNCRARALEHLVELRALPEWVAEEARHDSNERVRVLAQRRKTARRR